jgi:hypothetical protein
MRSLKTKLNSSLTRTYSLPSMIWPLIRSYRLSSLTVIRLRSLALDRSILRRCKRCMISMTPPGKAISSKLRSRMHKGKLLRSSTFVSSSSSQQARRPSHQVRRPESPSLRKSRSAMHPWKSKREVSPTVTTKLSQQACQT